MKGVGTDIGTIHFVGIGGIGMSGIAEVMHNLGYSVQGSDIAEGYVVEGLRKRGIKVMIGHQPENVAGTAVVVTSTMAPIFWLPSAISGVYARKWSPGSTNVVSHNAKSAPSTLPSRL